MGLNGTLAEAKIRTLKMFQMRFLASTTVQMPNLALIEPKLITVYRIYPIFGIAARFVPAELLFIPPEY